MKKGITIGVVVAILVAGAGWYAYAKLGAKKVDDVNTAKNEKSVVARVNGVDILKTKLDVVMAQLAKGQGTASSTPDATAQAKAKAAALNVLIGQELLKQAVKTSGTVATKDEIDKQMAAARKQFKTEKEFADALAAQSLSVDKLRSQFAEKIATQKYLLSKIGDKKPAVSAAEIKAIYEKAIIGVATPPTLQKSENSIKAFLLQQKQQTLINGVIDSLRTKAKIELL